MDIEGIKGRVLEVPVPEARYEMLVALKDKVLLLSRPIEGALGQSWAATGAPANGALEWYDLVEERRETLATEVAELAISGDRERLAYTTAGGDEHRLRVVASAAKPDKEHEGDPPGRSSGFVDLTRVRVLVDPGAEWAQMLKEAWRLQPEQFWTADLSGVDWQRALDRYLPLVERVATRTELSDLMWELQGELGTSHAYEFGGEYRDPPDWGQAHLGADFARDSSGRWAVSKIVPGSSWHPGEASPLLTPGADVGIGTFVLAVNGQPVDPAAGLGPLLANQAGQPVQLTVIGPGQGGRPAVSRGSGRSLCPRWRTNVPSATGNGWRPTGRVCAKPRAGAGRLSARAGHDALRVVGVPPFLPSRGGARRTGRRRPIQRRRSHLGPGARETGPAPDCVGRASARSTRTLSRRGPPGPLVLLTNEVAGSDGDIFTHGFKLLGLGPVVGTRTWGGVIGIDVTSALVDGSVTTQPEFAFWFEDVGWGVENHGADPDEEVVITPEDYAAGRDPQLERAIELVLDALTSHPPVQAEFDHRPVKQLPTLPARKAPAR